MPNFVMAIHEDLPGEGIGKFLGALRQQVRQQARNPTLRRMAMKDFLGILDNIGEGFASVIEKAGDTISKVVESLAKRR